MAAAPLMCMSRELYEPISPQPASGDSSTTMSPGLSSASHGWICTSLYQ